ncbi:MAG TPA: beta-ribofuranosylaminobenzene 5'-phosphate synthase family protein [Methylomirabilota bacterium]
MSPALPARVVVEAPARLHFGFLDLTGSGERRFGSIGVGVERPRYVVEARPAARTTIDGEDPSELTRVLAALGPDLVPEGGIAIRVLERIPRHQGLGSGTQRDLALGCAIARLTGRTPTARELAARLGRGRRSGVGVATFAEGGLVVDAGVAAGPGTEVPPVIFQRALPSDWQFVLATPGADQGVHGAHEEAIFRGLPAMPATMAGKISRLVLMQAMPAAVSEDIVGFGEAITEIQALMGEQFAPYQGGAYAAERGRIIAEYARKHGAVGVGQSSWGPTVFALIAGAEAADALVVAIQAFIGEPTLSIWRTSASAHGAIVRVEPERS